MPGSKALRKIQLGREATPGTAVAATTLWRGLGVPEDLREAVDVEEDIGIMGGADRSYIASVDAQFELESVPATFEQIFHIFEGGIKLVGTGVADGAGSGKIYAYTFPTTVKNTIKTYTIEGGDDQQAEEMEYSFVSEFGLEGAAKEALMMTATWKGRQITNTTFTGAISVPTVEDIIFNKGKLYIDAIGGTIGTTLISNSFLSMSLSCVTGWQAVSTADGNLYFSLVKSVKPELTCEITFEHDATAVAEKTNWRALTSRLIRIQFEGTALASPGTAYTYKTLRLDMAGRWSNFDKLGEQDGNDILTGTFSSRYNPTAGYMATFTVVNEIATVP